MTTKNLIDAVIAQMQIDIEAKDWTAIAELLSHVPTDNLKAFLPENGYMWDEVINQTEETE